MFALQGAVAGGGAVAAMVFVAAVTAVAMIVADRRSEDDQDPLAPAVTPGVSETLPYAALINVLPDPILVVSGLEPDDFTGRRYVFANSAARALFRIDGVEGLLVNLIRDPQLLEAVDAALFRAQDTEAVYETGGAQSRTFRAFARPIGLGFDGAHLALVSLRDETELRQVERTRVDFLANASHELRTPLASLSGFIETLRGHAKADEGARDRFLAIMGAQAERMNRLIDDLMSLSRIELNEHVAPSDRVDLVDVVADVVDAVGPLAAERRVKLEVRRPERGHAPVLGARDQLVQVVQNLVDNALKYSPDGGTVAISMGCGQTADAAAAGVRADAPRLSLLTPDHTGATYAVLRVGDQGPGIEREYLPRLTERFYRVEGQKSGERSGTGLGLAIVKHIVNRHRGGLQVESVRGEGATFTVYLPEPGDEGAAAGHRRESVMEV
ncbi:sensor histidine kinase [Phenylobacterium sp. VNQ135]|uniref:sensor histidine kinase n=1 Tax=Phenylobacterium sp. VNQ135 TaxID=3400922 RepID=UPI003C0635E3